MLSLQNLLRNRYVLSSLGLAALGLTGCGINSTLPSTSPIVSGRFGGIVHGGPNPVIGATVTLYATSTADYGTGGTVLGTAVTGNDGSFTFATTLPCTAGQQAYATATGGDPGAGVNPNYLLMAALGPCSTISSTTGIWISEATTVAAAYALRPFTTVVGPLVQVSAPANNNAAAGACTTSVNVTTGCTAAGLAHAFANALNLTNSVTTSAGAPTGAVYAVTPSNTSGSVPQALINALANSIEACVNSTGGTAGDSSACGKLFTYTTPPVTGGIAPTNTLQALLNLAQYPALTPTNVQNVFNLAGSVSFYEPALTSAPADFSLAIAYSGPTVAGVLDSVTPTVNNASGFGSGTAYIVAPNVTLSGGGYTTPATATASLGVTYFNVTGGAGTCAPGDNPVSITGGGGSGATAIASYDSTGAAIGGTVTASGSGYTSVPVFTVQNCATQPGALKKIKGMGVVAITITDPGSGYTSAPTVTIDAPTGSGAQYATPLQALATAAIAAHSTPAAYSLTMDANDNVYAAWQNALGNTGANSFITGISSNGTALFTSTPSTTLTAPRGAATDTLGHIWIAENNTTTVQALNTADGSVFTTLTTAAAPFGLGIDLANNVWYGSVSSGAQNLYELQQAAPTPYTNVTFATPPVFTNSVRAIVFDPNQNVFVSGFSLNGTNSQAVLPNAGTATAPSYGTVSAPVITATLTGNGGSGLALDAAENVWAPTSTGLFEVSTTVNGSGTATALSPTGPLTDNTTTPNYDEVDGAGSIWIADNQNKAVIQYKPAATPAVISYSPCYAPLGTQTCAASSLIQPQRVQVDSTGSVWITSLNNGRVYQLLGTGSPTWPQLSLGAPGVMPH